MDGLSGGSRNGGYDGGSKPASFDNSSLALLMRYHSATDIHFRAADRALGPQASLSPLRGVSSRERTIIYSRSPSASHWEFFTACNMTDFRSSNCCSSASSCSCLVTLVLNVSRGPRVLCHDLRPYCKTEEKGRFGRQFCVELGADAYGGSGRRDDKKPANPMRLPLLRLFPILRHASRHKSYS